MNSIDLVIPTMWCDENIISHLEKYCSYKNIQKIYLIDNKKSNRPTNNIFKHSKIHVISPHYNIYVNPAWNEGYFKSKSDIICLLNDDIFVEEEIFDYISEVDMVNIDIIGSYLKGTIDNYHIDSNHYDNTELIKLNLNKNLPIGGQSYAFGICMFIKRSSYKVIPSLYKIWYGDDYLVANCEQVYALKTNKIHGKISKTIVTYSKELSKRINLDTYNAYNYSHFKNIKNLPILKST